MTQKYYPCDTEPFNCPFDAQCGNACRNYCGVGVDEVDDNEYYDYDDALLEDLRLEQRDTM